MRLTNKVLLVLAVLSALVVVGAASSLVFAAQERQASRVIDASWRFQLEVERLGSARVRVSADSPLLDALQFEARHAAARRALERWAEIAVSHADHVAVLDARRHLDNYRRAFSELNSAMARAMEAERDLRFTSRRLEELASTEWMDMHHAVETRLLRGRGPADVHFMQEARRRADQLSGGDALVHALDRWYLAGLLVADRTAYLEASHQGAIEPATATIAAVREAENARTEWYRAINALLSLCAVLVSAVLWMVARRYLRVFFTDHAATMRAIQIGSTDIPLTFRASDELGQLMGALRTVAVELHNQRALLVDAERRQRALAEQRTELIRELHHRTKNNLQVMLSLVNLRRSTATQDGMISEEALQTIEHTIHAMAMAHEQLYSEETNARLELGRYVRDLATHLLDPARSMVPISRRIETDVIEVCSDTGIVVGIALNELLSNAVRHAFIDRSHGLVTVRVRKVPSDLIEIEIADDGCGFIVSTEKPDRPSTAVGLTIVQVLVCSQLRGRVEHYVPNGGGTGWRLEFPSDRA